MDIFTEVKGYVKPKTLALRILGQPIKQNGNTWFYYSPLRVKERTASLAVNDKKGFTDFGTGKNYDIFSFIAELNCCNARQACDIIINMFGLNLRFQTNRKHIDILKKQIEEQTRVQEEINNWYDDTYHVLTNIYKQYRRLRFILPTKSDLLPFIYQKEQYYESLVDIFYNADTEKKLILYKNRERLNIYERKGTIL